MERLSSLTNGQTGFIAYVAGSGSLARRLCEMGFVAGQEVTREYASPLGSPIIYGMQGQKVALRRHEARLVVIRPTLAEAMREAAHARTALPAASPQKPAHAPSGQPSPCCHGCSGCRACPAPAAGGSKKPRNGKLRATTRRAAQAEGEGERPLRIALVGNPNCGKTAFYNAAVGAHERTGNYAGITVRGVVGHTTAAGRALRITDLPGTYSLQAYSLEEAAVWEELSRGETDVIINVLDANNLERTLQLTLQLRATGIPLVGVLNMYDEFQRSGSTLDHKTLAQRLGIPLVPCVARDGKGITPALEAAVALATRTPRAPLPATALADTHATIHRALEGIYTLHEGHAQRLTRRADALLARSPLAYPIALALMALIFYLTFALGAYPMAWMERGIAALSEALAGSLAAGWARDLALEGILGGVGSVIVFLPNILILYFLISLLEDSGYLARAAFLFDPLLRRVGLHGKSFVPMLMGFGCSVPAVIATRTIESRKSRLLTMLTLPFMSCSARLPVYVVLTGAFFTPRQAPAVMLLLYAGGIAVAFAAAWVLSRTFRRSEESHFVMEMPPYRLPRLLTMLRHTWEKGRQYLKKMGGIILIASIGIWALGYFPLASHASAQGEPSATSSYLHRAGHAIAPALRPLGFDWQMSVGLLAGVGAKELMVSTLGVLYAGTPSSEPLDEASLTSAIRAAGITTPAAWAYLVFALLYFPCVATLAAIRAESGRWRYALFAAVYTTLLAYALSYLAYHLAS